MARPKNPFLQFQRRKQILMAAARVFKAKGFHAARTEDICNEAGLSAGTVFRHFKTKQEMILAIAQSEFENYRKDIELLASKAGLKWLGSLTEKGMKELLQPSDYDLGTDSWLELARNPETRPQFLEFYTGLNNTFTNELEKGKKDGWVQPQINSSGTASILLSIISGLGFDAEIGIPVDYAATAQALADLVTTSILTN